MAPMDSILEIFGKAEGAPLQEAVARLHEHFVREKMEPGAEHWCYEVDGRRMQLLAMLVSYWRRASGNKDVTVPFAADYLCECWVKWRKTPRAKKDHIRGLYGLPPLKEEAEEPPFA